LITLYSGKKISVSDREVGRCLEPEGNGVNPSRVNGGGLSPPSGEQDKQLITSRGGDNSLMEQQGRREEESGVTKRIHRAKSPKCVNVHHFMCKYYQYSKMLCSCISLSNLLLFQENKSYGDKPFAFIL
jgi:hypothetical protein